VRGENAVRLPFTKYAYAILADLQPSRDGSARKALLERFIFCVPAVSAI
jgi:hypothetical protein